MRNALPITVGRGPCFISHPTRRLALRIALRRSPRSAVALAGTLLILAGCVSPEAQRVRGGGAGADIGNRTADLKLHGGSRMYSRTPCLLPRALCPGPLPRSGLPGDFPEQRPGRR